MGRYFPLIALLLLHIHRTNTTFDAQLDPLFGAVKVRRGVSIPATDIGAIDMHATETGACMDAPPE